MKMDSSKQNHYSHLLIMAALSFLAMYILMYAMVNTFSNVYPNLNQLYMAGLMTTPMVIIELAIMRSMYLNKKMNALIIGLCAGALFMFWILIRQQTAISDKQFLKSMIPHHASALLMCQKASLEDPEIKELCQKILLSQQAEIDQMKVKLEQLK